MDRRKFLKKILRYSALGGIGLFAGTLIKRPMVLSAKEGEIFWQIDPYKCRQCGKCADNCVLSVSAVKCVHAYKVCGYCDLCSGYFRQGAVKLNTGAENQLCPIGALERKFIEPPYFEYKVDESLCIACGKCVKGCTAFGNGSLFLSRAPIGHS